ncbi:MAG: polysaccharide biosynthesis tyrosine autokinase [Planctomycetales bacterium]
MSAGNMNDWEAMPTLPAHASASRSHDSALDVFKLINVLWRRKWMIVLASILGIAGGLLYLSRQRTVYESQCQILISKKHSGMESQNVGSLSDYEKQISGDQLETAMVAIRSERIVNKAIEQGRLNELRSVSLLEGGSTSLAQGIISRLKTSRGGKDTQTKNANTISISFECYDPQDCATVLAAIVMAYQEFLEKSSENLSSEVVDLFQTAEKTLQEQFKTKQAEYHKFLMDTKLLRNANKDNVFENVHTTRVLEFEAAKSQNQIKITELKTSLKHIQEALKNKVPPEVIIHNIQHSEAMAINGASGTAESTLQAQFNDLKIQERSLLEKMGHEHPKVVGLRNQIQEIRRQLVGEARLSVSNPDDYITTYVKSLEHRLKDLQAREADFQKQIDDEMLKSKDVLRDELKDVEMKGELENIRVLGDLYVKRLQEISLIKDYGSYSMQVLADPEYGVKVGPRSTLILAAAAFVGMFLGLGVVYLAEVGDLSFHSTNEISNLLGVPILGRVPTAEAAELDMSIHPESRIDTSIAVYHRPKSRLAESFRAVRTSLFFNSNSEKCRVIQFTSADPGDGKSTIASNVAASIAQSGKNVLLVEADFRRPRVHAIFGLDDDVVGITSIISGEAELNDAIHETEVPHLSCLPCGKRPQNPSELLTSPQFKELLELLRDRFDFVILDTPPMLVVSDPSVVAARVDGTILAVRLKKNGRPGTLRAAEMLSSIGANLQGVVVNGTSESHRYGYGYGYSDSYSYANGDYSYSSDEYYDDEPEAVPELNTGVPGK